MRIRSLLVAPLLAFLTSEGLAAQAVHVVDVANGPGADFVNLTSAVIAASEGDVLLVRGGTYAEALVLDGKGLVVTADEGATVSVNEIVVSNLAVDQFVAIRGIDTVRPAASTPSVFSTIRGPFGSRMRSSTRGSVPLFKALPLPATRSRWCSIAAASSRRSLAWGRDRPASRSNARASICTKPR